MESIGRAYERGETQGFMKVIVEAATKKVLGAAILGIGGDEVVQAFLGVMTAGAPYTSISRTMHIHPTVAEYLPVVLNELKPLEPAARETGKTPMSAGEGASGEGTISGAIPVPG
jgi:hypothetical protein